MDQQLQTASPVLTQKTSRKTLVVFAMLLILVAAGSYFLGLQKNAQTAPSMESGKETVENASLVTPTTAMISPTVSALTLSTYTNRQINFSAQYPENWTAKELSDKGVVDGVEFTGPEGSIHAAWGSGFGGGCDDTDKQIITFFGKEKTICHRVTPEGVESWDQLYEDLGSKGTFGAYANANAPYAENRDVVLQVLSSFRIGK